MEESENLYKLYVIKEKTPPKLALHKVQDSSFLGTTETFGEAIRIQRHEKKKLLLSMKYWFVNDGILINRLWNNPYIFWVGVHPQYKP